MNLGANMIKYGFIISFNEIWDFWRKFPSILNFSSDSNNVIKTECTFNQRWFKIGMTHIGMSNIMRHYYDS